MTQDKPTSVPPILTSACDEYDPNSLNWQTAQQRILQAAQAVSAVETLALRSALGRVLAKPLISPQDVPNHTNSAMDGYAFNADDLTPDGIGQFQLIGESFAGKPFTGSVATGQCVRIMTGAVMPPGSDTVVMQEHVETNDQLISLSKAIKARSNVRKAGEDLKIGDTVLPAGRRLTSADIGIAASLGLSELRVYRRPRVAFFSNGDELRSVGTALNIGDVYDSNRYTLHCMLTQLGAEIIDLGIVPDDPAALRHIFMQADECADIVITSAGASVGDADYVYDILQDLGDVNFWKVAIKPGRPLAFGKLANSLFFGLPGNPVSVMATFAIFVSQAVRQCAGEQTTAPLIIKARCTHALRKRPGRTEFQRATARNNADGELIVESTGQQGSGILSSMRDGNCFIILPDDSTGTAAGEQVDICLFKEMYS